MATTNFGALTSNELTAWARDFWHQTRNVSFAGNFTGESNTSMIQRITELTKTNDGSRAVITMVLTAQGDGVVGDNQLEGNEEALTQAENVIVLDQWRKAHVSQGEMTEQNQIVKFRKEALDQLKYTARDIVDQLAILTLSGVAYSKKTNGATRVGSQLSLLRYAADVTPPSSRRYCRWDATSGLITTSAANTDLIAADTPTWNMLLDLKAYAIDEYIRPIMSEDGIAVYNVFMTPRGMAKLKKDADFKAAWQQARERGESNPLFKGTPHGGTAGVYVDGLNIMEYRHVYNTSGLASGLKWGDGTVEGQRILFCGAQSLAMGDIGSARWIEKRFDYDNRQGVSTAKIYGFKKPVFPCTVTGTDQDYGVICLDTAI